MKPVKFNLLVVNITLLDLLFSCVYISIPLSFNLMSSSLNCNTKRHVVFKIQFRSWENKKGKIFLWGNKVSLMLFCLANTSCYQLSRGFTD